MGRCSVVPQNTTGKVDNIFWVFSLVDSKAGHELCNFLAFNHRLKERKLFDSLISTVSVVGGIPLAALL